MSTARVVACLCADWCGVCREFRPVFERIAQQRADIRFEWIDVEDASDLMDDIDVETFPTLLVADGAEARFFGPVLPRADAVAAALRAADAGTRIADAEVAALARRIAASP